MKRATARSPPSFFSTFARYASALRCVTSGLPVFTGRFTPSCFSARTASSIPICAIPNGSCATVAYICLAMIACVASIAPSSRRA